MISGGHPLRKLFGLALIEMFAYTREPPPTPAPCTTAMFGKTRKSNQPW